ncbi:MAG: helix-turn-helix domain-containing protein [Magnetococcales bacterium]|nr:helix-turn-helix domain-containing protein [Magnetococcales bacterium]
MTSQKSRNDLLQEFESAPATALFDQGMVAAIRGCSPKTCERDRWAGGGVPFRKVGRLVRYAKADILKWIEQHAVVTSTSSIG